MKVFIQLLFIAIIAIALFSHSNAQGLTDPYDILQHHIDALGGMEKVKSQKTTYLEGEVDLVGTGLKGTFIEWSEVPVRKRQEVDLKIFKQVSGDDGKFAWTTDQNGKLQILKDEKSVNDRKLSILMAEYEHLNPESETFRLSFNGIDTALGEDCYLVRIANNLNSDTTINFYDTSTFMLLKTSTVTPENKGHIWFLDYRDVDGFPISFKQEIIEYPPGMKQVVTFTGAKVNIPIEPSLFEAPVEDVDDFRFTDSKLAARIPFRFIENHIYLEVEIGGKKRMWVLDTGAEATTINVAFAKELGLSLEGQIKGQGAGNLVDVSFATLPAFSLPGLEFDEQTVAVVDIAWLFERWLDMDIVGILGYDFLSRVVTKVDYANEILSFYYPDSFNYQGDGVVIESPVTQRKLMELPITVDGKYRGQWSLDLGAGGMSFHFPFAKENGLLDKPGVNGLGFGAGGSLAQRRILCQTMELAGFTINNIEATIPLQKGEGAFGHTELTGNIGNTLMKHFVLYLDYKREHLILEKGDDFSREFPRDNSGLQVVNVKDTGIQVIFVAENTPADKAGFKVNDIIRTVNGQNVKDVGGILAVYEILRQAPGTELKFAVARGEESKNLKMTLQNLFD